jgi:hypothetical protein
MRMRRRRVSYELAPSKSVTINVCREMIYEDCRNLVKTHLSISWGVQRLFGAAPFSAN